MPEARTPRIEALDRALMLLNEVAKSGVNGISMAELTAKTLVNKSTAYRALSTFKFHGFVTQKSNGKYVLGVAAINLAEGLSSDSNLVDEIHPALLALSKAADELVHLGVLVGDTIRYIDKVEPEHSIRVWSAIGQTAYATKTAIGRSLLAAKNLSKQQLKAYLPKETESEEDSLEHLSKAISKAQTCGYSVESGESMSGIACVGMAIWRGNIAVAALSVTGLISRMGPKRQRELVKLIYQIVPNMLPEGLSINSPSSS